MNQFDSRTVVLLCGIMSGLMSLVLFSLKRSYPQSIRGLGDWAGGLLLLCFAGVLAAMRGLLPETLTLSAVTSFYFLGLYWLLYGTEQFLQRPTPVIPWLTAIGILVALHVWFTNGQPSLVGKLIVINVGGILIFGAHAYLVSRFQQKGLGKWLTFGALISCVGLQILRLVTLFVDPTELDFLGQTFINQFYTVGFSFSVLLFSIGVLLMASEQLRDQLEQLATRDSLTQAFTRRHWNDLSEGEFLRCKRSGRYLAVLALDLDHFKAINDTHGHQMGDTVLKNFVKRVNAHLRHSDHLGRFGGEEFLLMLPDTTLDQALQVADRIRMDLAKTTGSPVCTVSIGVTTSDGRDRSVEAILARADAAMYRAKANGRNRIESA